MGFLEIAMRNYQKMKVEERQAFLPQIKSEKRSEGNLIELVTKAQVEQLNEQARGAGLMIGIPGELYTATISNVSNVYVEWIDGKWEAWRETHYPQQHRPISTKVIATGNTFDYVLVKVKRYLNCIMKKRGCRDNFK